jgi:hypothetical protein
MKGLTARQATYDRSIGRKRVGQHFTALKKRLAATEKRITTTSLAAEEEIIYDNGDLEGADYSPHHSGGHDDKAEGTEENSEDEVDEDEDPHSSDDHEGDEMEDDDSTASHEKYTYKEEFSHFPFLDYVRAEVCLRYGSQVFAAANEDVSENTPFCDPGSTITVSQFESILSDFASKETLNYATTSRLAQMIKSIFPNSKVPKSLLSSSAGYRPKSNSVFFFDCCLCGQFVYVGKNSGFACCELCKASRYTTAINGRKNKTPYKTLNYRSLILTICELLCTPMFLNAIQCHSSELKSPSLLMKDITDSDLYSRHMQEMKELFLKKYGDTTDVVSVALPLAIYYDGSDVFKRNKKKKIWPLMLSILSLPPSLRKRKGSGLFLISLFAGKLGTASEAFIFECLLQELQMLYKEGFEVHIEGITYFIQVRLIMHCYDSRALESVLRVEGSNSYAGCPLCRLPRG